MLVSQLLNENGGELDLPDFQFSHDGRSYVCIDNNTYNGEGDITGVGDTKIEALDDLVEKLRRNKLYSDGSITYARDHTASKIYNSERSSM